MYLFLLIWRVSICASVNSSMCFSTLNFQYDRDATGSCDSVLDSASLACAKSPVEKRVFTPLHVIVASYAVEFVFLISDDSMFEDLYDPFGLRLYSEPPSSLCRFQKKMEFWSGQLILGSYHLLSAPNVKSMPSYPQAVANQTDS